MTITQTVDIPADRRVTLDIPPQIPVGQVILTLTPKSVAAKLSKERQPGCVKGDYWMADDFDAPLED